VQPLSDIELPGNRTSPFYSATNSIQVAGIDVNRRRTPGDIRDDPVEMRKMSAEIQKAALAK